MKDIKILVSCHKESFVPKNKYIVPIQVGAAGKKKFPDMLHDDEGDNISEKNPRYCELTAQYWAWKNLDADYYGFFHYRRYLSFNEEKFSTDNYNNINFDAINDEAIKQLCLDEESIEKFIGDADIVVPEPMDLSKDGKYGTNGTVYNHYKHSKNHNIEDLEKAVEILKRLYPEYAEYADRYLQSRYSYFLNMYVMKKAVFFDYCKWLFPILDEFDAACDYAFRNTFEYRTPGLLAERLFGIFLLYLQNQNKNIVVKTAQQCFFQNTDNFYLSPAFPENNIAICLACDNNYAPFAGVVIRSIIENSSEKNNYDIILFCNNIWDKNKDKIKREVGGLKNFSIRMLNTACFISSRKLFERGHINSTTYLRLLIPTLLRNYQKVVYLDCDLVVNADIADFFNIDLKDNLLAAVVDTVEAGWCKQPYNSQKNYNKNVLGLTRDFEYFNAGVLLFNIQKFISEFGLGDLLHKAQSFNYMWQDQDILNQLCEGRTLLVEQSWNIMPHVEDLMWMPENDAPKSIYEAYMTALKNPKIVHYAGCSLPAFKPDVEIAEFFWKYARLSVFYEKVLQIYIANNVLPTKLRLKTRIRNWIVKKLFPKNTRRREWAKRVYYKLKGMTPKSKNKCKK